MSPNTLKNKGKKRRLKKAGLPPGSLVYVGERESSVRVTAYNYNETELQEKELKSIDECREYSSGDKTTWLNIDGVNDVALIQKIGDIFSLHPLVLEDIAHTTQRPKVDEYDDYIYVVLKMLDFDDKKNEVFSEQISLILTRNCVISFQEYPQDFFDPIRDRIRASKGRLRKLGPDYLLYTLIDAIVDHYFVVLEKIGEKLAEVEDQVIENPTPEIAHLLHGLKQETIMIRKSVWPLREAAGALERMESHLVKEATQVFFRDVYDHSVQVIDSVESYRDILSSLLEIYLATVSNKMNEIIKVLTIISTIFIPLTFVAGVYGMNFKYMPELEWQWGYALSLILMGIMAFTMLIFFRIKKWI